jgi:UPF0176 protein
LKKKSLSLDEFSACRGYFFVIFAPLFCENMKKNRPVIQNLIDRNLLRERLATETIARRTLSFYRYHRIDDPAAFRDELFVKLKEIDVFGRIYVASEGINGQISVPDTHLDLLQNTLDSYDWLQNMRYNFAREDDGKSFFMLNIKVRPQIVTDGLNDPNFDPADTGGHLTAAQFNELTNRPETVLVDMRNHYESEVGYFENAILPDADTFREALPMVTNMLADKKNTPVVMYCTGGIRCEKASAWLKHHGFEQVFQLDGGIIDYDRQVREQGLKNKFLGKNFVFDERRGERITEHIISNCHQCGQPADNHVNCVNESCHLLFIQCADCAAKMQDCCSTKCHDFIQLPKDEQKKLGKTMEFNGSISGRLYGYKARKKGWLLE